MEGITGSEKCIRKLMASDVLSPVEYPYGNSHKIL